MSLRSGIAAYFRHINNILATSPAVKSQDIFAEKRTRTTSISGKTMWLRAELPI
jgi:hypothetical protein